jgi:hypothetical protein
MGFTPLILNSIMSVLLIKFQLRKQIFWWVFASLFFLLILIFIFYSEGLLGKEYNFYFLLLIVMVFIDGLVLVKTPR